MAKKQQSKTLKWYQGLTEGMDQNTDSVLTDGSPLLENVSLEQVGNYATRKGSDLLTAKIGTNQGYGLFTYNDTSGNHYLMAVTDRDLFLYNESTGWGTAVDSDEWPASKRVDGVNFLNRLYLGSEDGSTALAYTTNDVITDVTPIIGGSVLAVNKNTLAVGGNSIKPNIIFYTDPFTDIFYSATGTCAANADVAGANSVTATSGIFEADIEGAVLYNTTDGAMAIITDWTSDTVVQTDTDTSGWDDDTIYVIQNNFKQDNACKGIVAFGESFVSWDEDKMYTWDPLSQFNSDIENYGCINYRTAKVINGMLIWMNRQGIYLRTMEGAPTPIHKKIQDRVNGFGLFDLIDMSNADEFCAGVDVTEGKYYLSVGTLKTVSGAPASAKDNVVLEFNTNTGVWKYHTFPDQIVSFTNWIDSNGDKHLVGIGKDNAAVWKLNTGTTDDDAEGAAGAISVEMRTPHRQLLEDPTTTNEVSRYYVKYTSTAEVTVKDSVDRGDYTTTNETGKLLPVTSTVKTIEIVPTANREGFTHSLSFTTTGKFVLEAYGFLVKKGKTTRLEEY